MKISWSILSFLLLFCILLIQPLSVIAQPDSEIVYQPTVINITLDSILPNKGLTKDCHTCHEHPYSEFIEQISDSTPAADTGPPGNVMAASSYGDVDRDCIPLITLNEIDSVSRPGKIIPNYH